jgi:hypothetical protein
MGFTSLAAILCMAGFTAIALEWDFLRKCDAVPATRAHPGRYAISAAFGAATGSFIGVSSMNKGLYALGGVIFALVVLSIITFFSGLVIGLVIAYSICDKGEMLTAVWTKRHPYIDAAFTRLILLAGVKLEDHHGRDDARFPGGGDRGSGKST